MDKVRTAYNVTTCFGLGDAKLGDIYIPFFQVHFLQCSHFPFDYEKYSTCILVRAISRRLPTDSPST